MSSTSTRGLVELLAPIPGWTLPLAEVPDPVFGQGLAGDGLAIDPMGEVLHAPCDGEVVLPGAAVHALSIRAACGEVLLHVGIDTVRMGGEGFRMLVQAGERVRAGQPLLEFDLALIARRAPSAVTPIVLSGQGVARIRERITGRSVVVGERILLLDGAGDASLQSPATQANANGSRVADGSGARRRYRVPFDHGLHARPAAQLAAALAGIEADVLVHVRGRQASARSTVGLMSLGVARGEVVELSAAGPGSASAFAAIERLLGPALAAEPPPRRSPGATGEQRRLSVPRRGDRLRGQVASRGLAEGVAFHWPPAGEVAAPVATPHRAAASPGAEQARLTQAIAAVRARLAQLAEQGGEAARGLMAAHQVLLADPELHAQAAERISAGTTAEQAWGEALAAAAEALASMDDARMAERRADLMDLRQQVLQVLAGRGTEPTTVLPERAIVLAHELLPSQLLALDVQRLAGVCMAAGGTSSHVAILATARGLPMLVGASASLLGIAAGTPLLLDAEQGELLVDPPAQQREQLAERRERRALRLAGDRARALEPALTRDGARILVYCNLGAASEAAPAVAAGAEGCGLLRTEFLFLERQVAPTIEEQRQEYQAIATALAGRPLTIRTLDAGGDKPIAYLPQPHEENPALGLRGVRTGLVHRDVLVAQLEAILAVDPPGQCRVLLPMVTDLSDVRTVRALLESLARSAGRPVPALGVMVETPAAALLAAQLCREVEFLSIGSNDLSQYTLAIDRQHATLGARLDALHPAVLTLIATCARAAHAHGRELGICGAAAGDPLAVPALIGLGVHELSASPAAVATVKGRVRALSLADCEAFAPGLLDLPDAIAVREAVAAWLARQPGFEGEG
jgi:phosphoenolpyruvate-protein phosphotransferase